MVVKRVLPSVRKAVVDSLIWVINLLDSPIKPSFFHCLSHRILDIYNPSRPQPLEKHKQPFRFPLLLLHRHLRLFAYWLLVQSLARNRIYWYAWFPTLTSLFGTGRHRYIV